ncbi:MAG: hypothetical protein JW717_01060 [Marinilabiliaceae bacterium]|nr:hypothetical protein [Marinilabiliaceae bacterium]
MKKEELVKIILNGINEVGILVQTFNEPGPVNQAFLKLTLQKIISIQQEIELLSSIASDNIIETPLEESLPSKKNVQPVISDTTNTHIEQPVTTNKNEQKKPDLTDNEILIIKDKITNIQQDTTLIKEISVNQDNTTIKENKLEIEDTPLVEPKNPSILGESLGKNIQSVADKINASKESNKVLIGKPVQDINKAIGINDRFLFQRELFGGNSSSMNQTIDQLNQLNTLEEAQLFLKSNFSWDMEDETVIAFFKTIQRKYIL